MMVEDLLPLLDGVRSSGKNRWIARCPHHKDKSPSLAITRGDRVPIVMHCFAGCDADQIAMSLGIKLSDLMPDPEPRDPGAQQKQRLPFTAIQAMQCLSKEVNFLFVCASDMARGEILDKPTRDALAICAGRINEARRCCNV